LEKLQHKHLFTLIFQENKGICAVLNRGIKEFAKGEYITFCASDDYWALDKLEKQVLFMEHNRFYPMCYGKTYYVDESSQVLPHLTSNNQILKGGWLFEDVLLFKIHPPVNYLYRKFIFDEIGYYDEKIFAEDYDINLRILAKYPIGFVDEYLGYYRQTDIPNKIVRFDVVSDSHLMSIDRFKEHRLYKKAKRLVYLRKFDLFSGFKIHKQKALLNMFKSMGVCYNERFMLAFIKFVIFWK
jgi:glycosyltransferase involved in cell wall biosynthesis